nr:hypothetical protein BSM_07260 [uncultured archaeon]
MKLRTLPNFQQWDFFFFLAFLIGLYSIHRLAMVREEGEVKEKIVVRELISEVKRPIRNFSTAGGLRHMVQFPFSVVKPLKKRNDFIRERIIKRKKP